MSSTLRAAALAASFVLVSAPAPADACGGFFCGNVPVDQTGEDILFATDGTDIQAHVRIAFAGDDENFAWVVPVPGVPELAVGSETMFNVLGSLTQPRWTLELGDADCADPYPWNSWDEDDDLAGDDDAAGDDDSVPDPGVEVLAEQDVGAYAATILGATDAQALLDWLNCNEYRIGFSSLPLIEAYINGGMNFLALKMRGGAPEGALTPIVMTYQAASPMIPIVLTAAATQPNLRVRAWFLANSRVVPTNYDHVWLNEARLVAQNWWWGGWYDDLVTHAVDEAGGQAFVTDYAGRSDIAHGLIYRDQGYDLDSLRLESTPWGYMNRIIAIGLPPSNVLLSLLRQYIPMPASLGKLDERSFYNNLDSYQDALAGQAFDPEGFTDSIDELIVTPMMDAEALFHSPDFPALTRMATTLSGWEMTVDPTFSVLPAALDYDTAHDATWPWSGAVASNRTLLQDWEGGDSQTSCWSTAATVQTAALVKPVLQFPSNQKVAASFPVAADLPDCQDLAAAMVIERFDASGGVVVRADQRADIQAAAPLGYCVPSSIPPAPTDAPDDWIGGTDLMPVAPVDPLICDDLEATGETGFGGTGDGPGDDDDDDDTGDDDAGDDDAGDDDAGDDDSAPAATCAGCSSSFGGGGFALLLLPLLGRRRR